MHVDYARAERHILECPHGHRYGEVWCAGFFRFEELVVLQKIGGLTTALNHARRHKKRDLRIRNARGFGLSVRQLSKLFGLCKSVIHVIINRDPIKRIRELRQQIAELYDPDCWPIDGFDVTYHQQLIRAGIVMLKERKAQWLERSRLRRLIDQRTDEAEVAAEAVRCGTPSDQGRSGERAGSDSEKSRSQSKDLNSEAQAIQDRSSAADTDLGLQARIARDRAAREQHEERLKLAAELAERDARRGVAARRRLFGLGAT